MGGVAGGLFVAHADVGDAFFLGVGGETLNGKSDNAEHVVDALFLQTARHQLGAGDGGHCFPSRILLLAKALKLSR